MKTKKIMIVLFLASLGLFIINNKAYAATTFEEWVEATNNGQGNFEQLGQENNNNLIFNSLAILAGTAPETIEETSVIYTLNNAIASLYSNPPASSIYFAQNVIEKIGGKPAYAQGYGFEKLQPILDVWKAFRNIAYLILSLIFIFIGIAIIFRVKISPQAVITIENALPKLIGALILITFSYAIAGALIDLMYVLMALGIVILEQGGVTPRFFNFLGVDVLPPTPKNVISSGFFGLIPMFFSGKRRGLTMFGAIFGGLIGAVAGLLGGGIIGTGGGLITGLIAGPALVKLIWIVIALFLLFKLFFALIGAYIRIVLSVILGPIKIMIGALPGQKGFGDWIKNILADILVFPAVVIIAMIGVYICQLPNFKEMWIPPLIGLPEPISGHINFAKTIVGMGFLLILPNVPKMVRGAFGLSEGGFGDILKSTIPFYGGFEKMASNTAPKEMITGALTRGGDTFDGLGQKKPKLRVNIDKGRWGHFSISPQEISNKFKAAKKFFQEKT